VESGGKPGLLFTIAKDKLVGREMMREGIGVWGNTRKKAHTQTLEERKGRGVKS